MRHPAEAAAGPVGVLVALTAALLPALAPASLPDIPAIAAYVEPPLLAWWLAPVAALLALVALALRVGLSGWLLGATALLALAPPMAAMPLALVALSLAALPGRGGEG